ncbi:unnamed protein product [Microthlaspi erraticum]|uniref:Uncharacterized protein n=1 Tax=Microthlaspi erraticum TaxID=1685480 RepID=A0A6D2HLW6_9BRAS|nr:unnamed protein product [Microthlaspi erraticum]
MDNLKILECGVQILSEETESSGGSEVDYFEAGGSNDVYKDGDEYYQPEEMTSHYDSKMTKVFAFSMILLFKLIECPVYQCVRCPDTMQSHSKCSSCTFACQSKISKKIHVIYHYKSTDVYEFTT